MLNFMEWFCLRMPWHKWVVLRERGHSRHIKCNYCGREYGMNDDAKVILTWDDDLAEAMNN